MSNSDYLPSGSGPHPTLAGNVLDPNIKSDGKMSGGPGVGGTSEQHIREEGAEHVRQNPDTTIVGSSGGLSSFGAGGVSGSSYESDRAIGSETSQTTSGGSGGVLGSAMSYLGLGGKSGEQQSGVTEDKTSSYTSGTGSTAVGDSSSYEPQSSSFGETSNKGYGETSNKGFGESGASSDITGGPSGNDLASQEAAARRTPADSNVHTGSDPLESAKPVNTDTAHAGTGDKDYEAKLHDKHASTRENTDAIPTAGGEKLGAKHWGESKVVPENPQPEGGAGVSSSEFSNTVRDNTNRNTGPISEPTGTGAHGKESLVDKMKDKLHLGSSLGSADAH